MSISQQDIFQEACFRLSLSGTDPLSKRIWMKANVCLMLSVFSVMVMLTAKTFMSVGKDVDFMVDSMISFTVNYQFGSKLFIILYYKREIADLIRKFSTFWPLEVTTNHEDLQFMRRNLFFYKNTIRAFFALGSINVVRFIFVPQLSSERTLPYTLWLPKNAPSPYYELLYAMEVYEVFMLLSMVIGIDGLFIAFAGSLGIQFRLLAERMSNLNGKQDLQECVEHHKSQYFLIVVTICMNLYIMSVRSTMADLLAGAAYMCSIVMELNIYCIMSQIVVNESEKLTTSLYKSGWYEHPMQTLAKDVHTFMMFLKPLTFRILGVIPVNMECYINILKAAFSYYTVMKRFKSV